MDKNLTDIKAVKKRICHWILLAYALIMTLILGSATQGDLHRTEDGDLHPLLFAHIGILCTAWLLLFLRRRIPFPLSAAYLCLTFLFIGLASIYEFGLIGPGAVWLLIPPLLATTFFDKKTGLFFLLTAVGGYLLIGNDTISEARLPPVELSFYTIHTRAWAAHIVSFLVIGTLLIAAISTVNAHLLTALKSAGIREKEIEEQIEKRTAEINNTNERVAKISHEDPLTKLLNRRSFVEMAEHELAASKRTEAPLCLLLLDADHLKKINDIYGYVGGDIALIAVANFLRDTLRKTDILGRLGREEFAAILPDTPVKDAKDVAEKIRKGIEKHSISFGGEKIKVTVSIGVTTANQADTLDTLMHRADVAISGAKDGGRNKVVAQI